MAGRTGTHCILVLHGIIDLTEYPGKKTTKKNPKQRAKLLKQSRNDLNMSPTKSENSEKIVILNL